MGRELQDVFKTSGMPTHTFVKPLQYTELLVALKTPGRGIVVEGPSGIGKTVGIKKVIEELKISDKVEILSARKENEIEKIKKLLEKNEPLGIVIVDDFHVLEENIKKKLADLMKTLADNEEENSKLIIIGINKAGDSLVKFAPDLNNRIDTIKFEKNPLEKIKELIELGEHALNISIKVKKEIVEASQGSFHLAQLLCQKACIYSEITKEQDIEKIISISIEVIKQKVNEELSRVFYSPAKAFAIGTKMKRGGRAPYLHLLYWLSESDDWTIQIDDIISQHPEYKGSIIQVTEKGFLSQLIKNNNEIANVIHYEENSKILAIENPKFLFYLKNLLWKKFSKQIGFIRSEFKSKYDFALSFAGEERQIAENLFNKLQEEEIQVFYDKNETVEILAENIEDYLGPIYKSQAEFVIVLLSKNYPKKVWTKFESESFKERFGENAVIPIWFSDAPQGIFDESRKYGGIELDTTKDSEEQLKDIVEKLIKKLPSN